MAFELAAMKQVDHARIFSAANQELLAKYCGVYSDWNPSAKYVWAIERATGNLFYRLPTWAPHDGVDRFLLIFDNLPLVVEMDSDEAIRPLTLPERLTSQLEEIRQAIRDAFEAHGFFGVPPRDAVDIPAPTFK